MEQNRRHHYIDTIGQVLEQAVDQKIIQLHCDQEPLQGTRISVQGHQMVNFGSCSYLGLEQDSRLIDGVISAVTEYGTQFSSSRAYLSVGLYSQLEQQLAQLFNGPVVVTPTTSLGHQAALPVLIRDEDVVILDHQVHASVQSAVQLLKPRGIPVHHIRHNRLDQLESLVRDLRSRHRHIWYLADGIYSMYGDAAPLADLEHLLERYEQLHLYLDDAHGMSWAGASGCGYVRSQMKPHPRVMLAVSLNKAFAAAGGALVFPSEEWARKVRTCGPTLIFSGPVQPPMLGAAVASAGLHLSGDVEPMQRELNHLLDYTRGALKRHNLPVVADTPSPIFFIATGLPRVAYNLVGKLYQEGCYLNVGTFPATPMQRGGVRFTVTRHHTEAQIEHLAETLAHYYPRVLEEEGISPEDLERDFDQDLNLTPLLKRTAQVRSSSTASLGLVVEESAERLNAEEWDALFDGRGQFSVSYLKMLEQALAGLPEPENQWQFRYLIVRDGSGRIVLASVLTAALMKDDLFAPVDISTRIEDKRCEDPYWLTSTMLMTGTPCSEGQSLYIDRSHVRWKAALSVFADEVRRYAERIKASSIMLRDFEKAQGDSLAPTLLGLGFVEVRLPDRYLIDDLGWQSEAEYLARLSGRYRYNLRKEALAYRDQYLVRTDKSVPEDVIAQCYELYRQVHARGRTLNTFPLSLELIRSHFRNPECDVLRIYLKEKPGQPVAVMFSHFRDGLYSAGLVGLDYRYLETHKVYKQILYRTVERAHELGAARLQLGFTAGLEKRKVGAQAVSTVGFALVLDHFNMDIIEAMSVAPATKSSGVPRVSHGDAVPVQNR